MTETAVEFFGRIVQAERERADLAERQLALSRALYQHQLADARQQVHVERKRHQQEIALLRQRMTERRWSDLRFQQDLQILIASWDGTISEPSARHALDRTREDMIEMWKLYAGIGRDLALGRLRKAGEVVDAGN